MYYNHVLATVQTQKNYALGKSAWQSSTHSYGKQLLKVLGKQNMDMSSSRYSSFCSSSVVSRAVG